MRTRTLIAISVAIAALGCTSSKELADKEAAAEMGGTDEMGRDLCELNGWYLDGVCDSFCPSRDPDCADAGGCIIAGCSNEFCVDADGPVPGACVDLPEAACYDQFGACERQDSGACGWTESAALDACIDASQSGGTECTIGACGCELEETFRAGGAPDGFRAPPGDLVACDIEDQAFVDCVAELGLSAETACTADCNNTSNDDLAACIERRIGGGGERCDYDSECGACQLSADGGDGFAPPDPDRPVCDLSTLGECVARLGIPFDAVCDPDACAPVLTPELQACIDELDGPSTRCEFDDCSGTCTLIASAPLRAPMPDPEEEPPGDDPEDRPADPVPPPPECNDTPWYMCRMELGGLGFAELCNAACDSVANDDFLTCVEMRSEP